jgi:hypothetical protein
MARRKEQDFNYLYTLRDQRNEKQQAVQSKQAEAAQKEASLKAVRDKYQHNPLKNSPITVIEQEITKAREDFQSMVTTKIASEIKDPFIDPQFGASRDNLRADIANIPSLFDDSAALRKTLSEHLAHVRLKASEIRGATNLNDADKLLTQLQNFHQQEFTLKIKAQMQEIPTRMVEKIKKALDVPPIPEFVPLASPMQVELSELEKLKSELALERKKIQDLEMMNKIILGQNVDLMKDKNYWQEKFAKKDAKVKKLTEELQEIKFQADNTDLMQYNPIVTDSAEMKVMGANVESDVESD